MWPTTWNPQRLCLEPVFLLVFHWIVGDRKKNRPLYSDIIDWISRTISIRSDYDGAVQGHLLWIEHLSTEEGHSQQTQRGKVRIPPVPEPATQPGEQDRKVTRQSEHADGKNAEHPSIFALLYDVTIN
jgi:hypothetical protein